MFLSSPNDIVYKELYSVHLSSNFNSCSERLREEIGQTLNNDDSCDLREPLVMFMNYFYYLLISP